MLLSDANSRYGALMSREEMENPMTLLSTVAQQVRTARRRRGWTAAELGAAMTRVGVQWDRFAVTKLENGKRKTLTLTELAALARVLEIPPVLLLFPLGHAEQVEVLPGQIVGTWAGLKWFTGEAPFPTDTLDGAGEHPGSAGIGDMVDGPPASTTLHLFQSHRDFVREHALLSLKAKEKPNKAVLQELSVVEAKLALVRQQMRKRGLTPPTLADELKHVDQRQHFDLTSPEGREKAKAWLQRLAERGYGTFTESGDDEAE